MNTAVELTEFAPSRFTDSRLYIAEIDSRKWLVKVYANAQQQLRRDLEHSKLLHWRERAFPVPQLLDVALEGIAQPHLVMEYVEGVGLGDYLKNPGIAWPEKKKTLDRILRSNARRHILVSQDHDVLLIHSDPNTDNILLQERGEYFYIDFEHPGSVKDIETAVAAEVATFIRRVLNDVGAEFTEEVVELLLRAYEHDATLLARIESLTLARPFQLVHRFRDRKKKRKNPGLITRYDVADAIYRLRRR